VDAKIAIENNIPLPTDRKRGAESLPKLPFVQMRPGQSFFIETRDEEHTKRKLGAVRSAVRRFIPTEGLAIRVFKWVDKDSGKQGVRVFCVNDNGTDK